MSQANLINAAVLALIALGLLGPLVLVQLGH